MSLWMFTILLPCLCGISLGLSPNGTNVCGHECSRLEWETVQVTRACGYPHFKNTCNVFVRRPNMRTTTCYECCTGWRQSDDISCLAECPSGAAGVASCEDLPDGWYQLCDSCAHFAHCEAGDIVRMRCPARRRWDDYSKKCVKHSQTCEDPQADKVRYNTKDMTNEELDEDAGNEMSNRVDLESGQTCEDMKCGRPGRCIMVFAHSTFTMQPKCICPAGMRMDEDTCQGINECVEQSPCGEHGACVDRPYGYACRCERSWRGRHCNKPRRRNRKHRKRTRVHTVPHGIDDVHDVTWDQEATPT